jgi:hypothetical protein
MDTSPSKEKSEIFFIAPSDGCPATATCLASTQAMRSRHVSSASKSPDCIVAHRSDRYPPVRPCQTHRSDQSGAAAPPSSILQSWLCGSTKEPSSFLVNHRKPREPSGFLVATSIGLGNDLSRVSSPKGLSRSRSPLPWGL